LRNYIFLALGRVGSVTENVEQKFVYSDKREKKSKLLQILRGCQGLTLVFVETKRFADALEQWLLKQGLQVTSIHGDRSQPEREASLAAFRSGRCPVLVATSLAARGLDIPNILQVINYDIPSQIDEYVHRIGRTGRVGHKGTSIGFVDEHCTVLRELAALLKESKQELEPWFETLVNASRNTDWGDNDPARSISTETAGAKTVGAPTGAKRSHRKAEDNWWEAM